MLRPHMRPDSCEPKEPYIRWGSSWELTFHGDMCRPIVTLLRMRLFRPVCLPPLANVPAQRTRRTNAFAGARSDKMAMWPFAKLLWTLHTCSICEYTHSRQNVPSIFFFMSFLHG